jgi:hypothetical protein
VSRSESIAIDTNSGTAPAKDDWIAHHQNAAPAGMAPGGRFVSLPFWLELSRRPQQEREVEK